MATTRNFQSEQVGFIERTAGETNVYPPAVLEYAWYASLIYTYLGQTWGIVIPSVGGVILTLVSVACFLSVGGQNLRVYRPVTWGFYTGISVIAIQVLFHDTDARSLLEVIAYVGWLELLIIVQTLSLRPGFLHRFALVTLAIGMACLPYINIKSVGGVMRAWASGTTISNPNVLGLWFGFCTVYFLFWGLQSQKMLLRVASWGVALGCFYIVTLTVSRAPLLGIVLACIVGFRSALKRSFVPLLSFALVLSLTYASGVFDEEIGYYTTRGAEESGRGKLWPIALERIIGSPWVGEGLGNVKILTDSGRFIRSHNPFLALALSAGIIPVICFLGYLAQVAIGTHRIMQRVHVGEAALLPPLVAFGLFDMMTLDLVFTLPLMVVVFGLAANAGYGMVPKVRGLSREKTTPPPGVLLRQ